MEKESRMSHKIIVELDERAERIIRKIAEHDVVSVAKAATELFCDYMGKLEKLMPAIEADAENKPTIYISGPITSDPDYKAKFEAAQVQLEAEGYELKNPAALIQPTQDKEWSDYMALAIAYMLPCEQVYMLKGWENSTGATLELKLAVVLGKYIKYE